jgi:lipopolysaccharide heptosyltransferase III
MRIALIKTGALGDVVRTTALLPGLRRLDPQLDLTWVTARGALDLVRSHPDAARAVTIDDPDNAPWRHERYDWLLSLDDDAEACRLASRLSAARVSGAYETLQGDRCYTDDVAPWFGMGILRPSAQGGLDRANELKKENTKTVATIFYEALGLPFPVARPYIGVADEHFATARRRLAELGLSAALPLVGMNTGAGTRWRFKSWGEDQTAELARRLHDEQGAGVLMLGGSAERERNAHIVALANRPRVVAAPTNLELLTFTALIGLCRLLVTSDSLALHLGTALGKPVVAFFGPTSGAEIDLYDSGEKVITPLECRCCYLKTCDIRPHCMQSIGVDRLFDAVCRWLPESRLPENRPV